MTRALESRKNLHLMGSFWPKYMILAQKKWRRVIFHDTREWWKIWRKSDLWFRKWHDNFGKFLPEHSKALKLGLRWDPFIQSTKYMTVCSCHVTYVFQSESILYSCLNVKELLARSRHKIWGLSDCNWTRTQNLLVRKWTLNHLPKWLSVCVFVYKLSGSGFKSSCSY